MEEALKIIGLLASLFAVYKIVVDVIMAKSSNRREEYQFAKDYYQDLNNEGTPAFVLEKGFLALTGKSYSVPEIKYLLSFDNPSEIINCRANSSKFVEFNYNQTVYFWKWIFKSQTIRNIAPLWYIGFYCIFASIALLPIYTKAIDGFDGIPLVAFSLSMGIIAIACLISHADFKFAKELMNQQKNI